MTPAQLEAKRQQPSTVDCGPCTACCKHDHVILGPKDDPAAFKWHEENGYVVLDRKDNGDCVYLEPAGCGIHGAAPDICKRFDCRVLYSITPSEKRALRAHQNPQMIHIYRAGAQRLATLK